MKRNEIDWMGVHTENKWTILKDQWRFGLWAFFTSMGSVMFGFDLGVGQQILAMVRFNPFSISPLPHSLDGRGKVVLRSSPLSNKNSASRILPNQAAICCLLCGNLPGLAQC